VYRDAASPLTGSGLVAGLIMGIAFILRGLFIQDYAALAAAGFIGFAANSWLTACLFTYTAENFPTRIRSIASGTVEGLGSALATAPKLEVSFFHVFDIQD
jgi:hypothetical protein